MVTFRIALRSFARRRGRMVLIAALVVLGTVLIVFGTAFSQSAKVYSKQSIIDNFTGDLVLYSDRSREVPSPFSFNSPLPLIADASAIEAWLSTRPEVADFVSIAQNYGTVSVKREGRNYDLPIIFYAVDPERYRRMFGNMRMSEGTWFGEGTGKTEQGVLVSVYQNQQYRDKYGTALKAGDEVTLLSLTAGGSVNALPGKVSGIFDPQYYRNVFNYINFMDIGTYASLYNFTGVKNLPDAVDQAMSVTSEDDIFALAGNEELESIDTASLESADLSGYAMIAVKLASEQDYAAFSQALAKSGFAVKTATWDQASAFFASVADILQGVIWGITLLIFLIVAFIMMNTLIISVLERTGEIGTYRAIGSSKGFVRSVFLWESIILNGIGALIGMALSLVLILALQNGVQLPELMSQYLVGGGPLKIALAPEPFVLGVVLVFAVSILATLYPVRVATKVSPLAAMSGK